MLFTMMMRRILALDQLTLGVSNLGKTLDLTILWSKDNKNQSQVF